MSNMNTTDCDSIAWIPVCCERVMRHNVFGDSKKIAATLVCTHCGKHITLQPHTSSSIAQYGEGARIVQVVAVARPAQKAQPASATTDATDEKTM